ncbi:MAG: GAF domain-containing protein [Thermodesulfobacteriota bacterium]
MRLPLHKTMRVTAVTLAVALLLLLGLGVRQYQLYLQQAEVSRQTERLLFQFLVTREQITESLLDGQPHGLHGVATDLEDFGVNLAAILKDRRIDGQYRLGFANAIDLPGMVLLAKRVENGLPGNEDARQLNRTLRSLGERLVLFDRMLVEHARLELTGFQNVVIGALALVVSMIVALVVAVQWRFVRPLIDLHGQVRRVSAGELDRIAVTGLHGEISELAYAIHDLLVMRDNALAGIERLRRIASGINKARRTLAEAESRDALFRGVCRALLANEEYCLVWIGLPGQGETDVVPVSADGATTMTCKECESCVAILLTEAEERGIAHNPAAQALRLRRPVVLRDLLRDAPRGLLKGTPLAGGQASCVALPVGWQGDIMAVLSVYAASDLAFDVEELEMLAVLAADLGLVLHLFSERDRMREEMCWRARVLEEIGVAELAVAPDGAVLSGNAVSSAFFGLGPGQLPGCHWRDLLRPIDTALVIDEHLLLERLRAKGGEELASATGSRERRLRWRWLPDQGEDGKIRRAIFVGWLANVIRDSPVPQLELASVTGVVAGGVAHELSDLCNGMINYAQVLADEEQLRAPGEPLNPLLVKVIEAGERMAGMVGKLIFYDDDSEATGEYLPLVEVLTDALLLTGYRFKSDGIQLELRLPEETPPASVRAQSMQRVLIGLLDAMRRTMGRTITGRSPRKRLEVEVGSVREEGRQALAIHFIDHSGALAEELRGEGEWLGEGDVRLDKIINACLPMVEEQGGKVTWSREPKQLPRVTLLVAAQGSEQKSIQKQGSQ